MKIERSAAVFFTVLAACAMVPTLGCEKKSETEKVIDKAADNIEDAADEVGDAVEDAGDKLKDGVKK